MGAELGDPRTSEVKFDIAGLKLALESGMISYAAIQEQIDMADKNKYLQKHEFKIYQGKDGKWNTYVPDDSNKHKRKLIRKNSKKEVEDYVVKYYKKLEREPTVEEVFRRWATSKLEYGEIEKQTYDRYDLVFKQYFIESGWSKRKINTIDEIVLEDFIKRTIHDNELTVKGWSNLRIIIRGVFKYAKKMGLTALSISQFMGDLDLSKNIFKRKIKLDDEEVFTEDEIKKIRDCIYSHGLRVVSLINLGILFDIKTGLRAGELSALRYEDIKDGILTVRRTEVRFKDENGRYEYDVRDATKGRDGVRRVILPKEAVDLIEQIRKINPFGEYIFQRPNGNRIHGREFSIRLKQICKSIGIKERTLHKIRKTYATMLLNANVDEKLIMNQMGHTDIATTKNFYYFDNHNLEESRRVIGAALGGF